MKEASIAEIKKLASCADAKELDALRRSLARDTRRSIAPILEQAQRRIEKQNREDARLNELYSFERSLCKCENDVCAGFDEVGRGPLAGPVAVGAVVLPAAPKIPGLNDSKKIPERKREQIAKDVKSVALAWDVEFIEASKIDEIGIAASLREAFSKAIDAIDKVLGSVDRVLIDGNPLHIDPREKNVVKGDGKCASIAAASILAKVARDALMCDFDKVYPEYKFAENKGYGTAAHIEAIKDHGLCNIHRKSFCAGIIQETLF